MRQPTFARHAATTMAARNGAVPARRTVYCRDDREERTMTRKLAAVALGLGCVMPAGAQTLTVLAAGSLREAMNELGDAYRAQSGVVMAATYGPSGKLRAALEQG